MAEFEHDVLPIIFDTVRQIDAQIAAAIALGKPSDVITSLRAFRAQCATAIPGSETPHSQDDYLIARDFQTSNIYELPISGVAPTSRNLPSLGFPIADVTGLGSMDSYPLMAFDPIRKVIWVPVYYDIAVYIVDSVAGHVVHTINLPAGAHPSSCVWNDEFGVMVVACNAQLYKVDPVTYAVTSLGAVNCATSGGNGVDVSDAGWVYFMDGSTAHIYRINLNGATETQGDAFPVGSNTPHRIIVVGADVFVIAEAHIMRFEEAGPTPWPQVAQSAVLTSPSSQPYGGCYSPISGKIYAPRTDGKIDVYDPATLSVTSTISTPQTGDVGVLLINPNNGSLYAICNDNRIYVINVLTEKIVNTIQTNIAQTRGAVAVFDTENNRLALAYNGDTKLKQWAP